MIRVRIRKDVSIEGIGLPPPTFVLDQQGRPVKIIFDYTSIRVLAQPVWAGAAVQVSQYIRTVLDQGDDGMALTTTLVTSAQLKALTTTPITLVPAPGAGFAILPLAFFEDLKFGTTAYTAPAPTPTYSIGTETVATVQVSLTAAANRVGRPLVAAAEDLRTVLANTALSLTKASNDLTLGDGTLTVTVSYLVVALS